MLTTFFLHVNAAVVPFVPPHSHSRPAVEGRVQLPPQRPLSLRPHSGLDRSAVAPWVAHRQLLGSDARILIDGEQKNEEKKDKRQQSVVKWVLLL